jgi:hypothetical protein
MTTRKVREVNDLKYLHKILNLLASQVQEIIGMQQVNPV